MVERLNLTVVFGVRRRLKAAMARYYAATLVSGVTLMRLVKVLSHVMCRFGVQATQKERSREMCRFGGQATQSHRVQFLLRRISDALTR